MLAHDEAAVVIAAADGRVKDQDPRALRIFGQGIGRDCWDVVGALEGAAGLPCAPRCVQRLLASGVDHGVKTSFSVQDRPHCLNCIPVGDTVVCVITGQASERAEPWERLTPRELEILKLVAQGGTTASIAGQLGLSGATVRTHIEHMRTRMNTATRASLVAKCFRLGLVA